MTRRTTSAAAGLCCLLLASAPPLAAAEKGARAGFVDGSFMIDLAGDDAVSVEVSLEGALLRAILKIDPELGRVAAGLESIHAVILEGASLGGETRARIGERMLAVERQLAREGWQRIALVREAGEEVRVLMLGDDEGGVRGLVAMVSGEEEIVFTNLSGRIDLAAIGRLAEELDLPALDAVGKGADQEDEP